nr:hypothetical protein [Borreliella burgdorferi]
MLDRKVFALGIAFDEDNIPLDHTINFPIIKISLSINSKLKIKSTIISSLTSPSKATITNVPP